MPPNSHARLATQAGVADDLDSTLGRVFQIVGSSRPARGRPGIMHAFTASLPAETSGTLRLFAWAQVAGPAAGTPDLDPGERAKRAESADSTIGSQGELDRHHEPRLGVGGGDGAVVQPHRAIGDGQPQADAAARSAAVALDPKERLEDAGQGVVGNARTVVADGDPGGRPSARSSISTGYSAGEWRTALRSTFSTARRSSSGSPGMSPAPAIRSSNRHPRPRPRRRSRRPADRSRSSQRHLLAPCAAASSSAEFRRSSSSTSADSRSVSLSIRSMALRRRCRRGPGGRPARGGSAATSARGRSPWISRRSADISDSIRSAIRSNSHASSPISSRRCEPIRVDSSPRPKRSTARRKLSNGMRQVDRQGVEQPQHRDEDPEGNREASSSSGAGGESGRAAGGRRRPPGPTQSPPPDRGAGGTVGTTPGQLGAARSRPSTRSTPFASIRWCSTRKSSSRWFRYSASPSGPPSS